MTIKEANNSPDPPEDEQYADETDDVMINPNTTDSSATSTAKNPKKKAKRNHKAVQKSAVVSATSNEEFINRITENVLKNIQETIKISTNNK